MKKVAFFVSDIGDSGGTERVSIVIANELVKQGYQVSFISIAKNKSFFPINEQVNIEYLDCILPYSLKKDYFKITSRLRSKVKELGIESLVVVDGKLSIFSAIALLGLDIKHINWEHYSYDFCEQFFIRRLSRYFSAYFCHEIITLTDNEAVIWQNKFKLTNKVQAISNPNTLLPTTKMAHFENKKVLSIGHLVSYKGFDYLLKAWALSVGKDDDWILQIVGSGEQEQALKSLAQTLNISKTVEFIPRSSQIEQFYENASIYCLPSQTEGLPLVLIESMAFGLPIIAFNCSTGVESLVLNNENGFLCEQNNVEEMANKLSYLMNNPETYQEMSQASVKLSQRFNIETIIEKWKEIL